MSSLPTEIIKEIFDYLPIPTYQLFGKGDGGARRWKEVKNITFSIEYPLKRNEDLKQLEYNKYYKVIQVYHISFKSLLDSYHRPPFYPDGLSLHLGGNFPYELSDYPLVMEKFDINWLNGEYPSFTKIASKLSELDLDAIDKCSSKSLSGPESAASGPGAAPSKPLAKEDARSTKRVMRLKRLNIGYEDWNKLRDLEESSKKVTIGVDSLTFKFNRVYTEVLKTEIDLDLTSINPEELEICSLRPLNYISLKLPHTLKSLSIQAETENFYGVLPSGLESLSVVGTKLINLSPIPLGIQKLDLSRSPGSLSRFSALRSVYLRYETPGIVIKLPQTLEELIIGDLTEIAVDLVNYPNLKRLDFKGVYIPNSFRKYKLIKVHENSFSFNLRGTLYSIPVHKNLKYCFITHQGQMEAISYPESLRHLQINNSDSGFLRNLPLKLENFAVQHNQRPEIVELPPNLNYLQIIEQPLKIFKYDKVKHLTLIECKIESFEAPPNLKTFHYSVSWTPTEPKCFNFLGTTLSSLSYFVGDYTSLYLDFAGVKIKVIVPPTIKYVAFHTPRYSHELVYMKKGKVREV